MLFRSGKAQSQADHALLQHGARAVAVLHVANFVGQHAHQGRIARAGGLRGQFHHRIGHDDGAAWHGKGVGRHAGAKTQLQLGRVAVVGFGVSRPRSTLMFACFIPCVSYRNAQK